MAIPNLMIISLEPIFRQTPGCGSMIFPANETSMSRGFASHVGLPEGSRSVLEQLELPSGKLT